MIEGFQWGGQLMITSEVENYPGYPDGVMGPEMMQEFRYQAERFGAEFVTDDVTRVDFSERPFRVWVGDDEYRADSVIVANGAQVGECVELLDQFAMSEGVERPPGDVRHRPHADRAGLVGGGYRPAIRRKRQRFHRCFVTVEDMDVST